MWKLAQCVLLDKARPPVSMGTHVSSREAVSNHPLLSTGGGESAVHCSLACFYSEGLFVDPCTEIIDTKVADPAGSVRPRC